MKIFKFVIIFILTIVFQKSSLASCQNYGFNTGILPDGIGENKFISTYEEPVPVDDVEVVQFAIETATDEAKALIVKFMSEEVAPTCNSSKKVIQSSLIANNNKTFNMEKTKEQLCTLTTSSKALLRGVMKLGSCYEPGKYVRVTVGVKNETIKAAEKLAKEISKSVKKQQTPTNENIINNIPNDKAFSKPNNLNKKKVFQILKILKSSKNEVFFNLYFTNFFIYMYNIFSVFFKLE